MMAVSSYSLQTSTTVLLLVLIFYPNVIFFSVNQGDFKTGTYTNFIII